MNTTLLVGLQQGFIWAGPALCFSIAYRLFQVPDLTVEGSFCVGAAIYAVAIRSALPPLLAMLLAIVGGALAGATTGLVHRRLGVNAFLSGIIVVAILYSLTLRIMGGSNVSLLGAPALTSELSTRTEVPVVLILAIGHLGLLCGLIFLLRSRLGIRLRVAGANPALARRMGIRADWYVVAGLGLCNGLAAMSGGLLAEQDSFADISLGQGVVIIALAALTIGERLVSDRRLPYHMYIPIAAIVGSLGYSVVSAFVLSVGIPTSEIRLATGLLVLAAVVLGRSSRQGLFLSGEVSN